MIGVELLLGAALAAIHGNEPPADGPQTRTEVRSIVSLDITDEIAPAILPYVSCRLASAGIPLRSSRDGPEETPTAAVGAGCTESRAEAARRAEAMLRAQRRGSRSERRVYVERVLSNVDNFASGSLMAPQVEEKPDATNR
jgi:hypothetical protein